MSVPGDNSRKQMERLTTCPICLDKFRIPKVLPCMHTFCLTPCLTSLVDPRARSLRCPECRRDHVIPPGGVQAFPANLTMIGFLDIPQTTTINLPDRCYICKEHKQTLIQCHDCSKFLCGDCREPHLRETFYAINASINQIRNKLPRLSDKISTYDQRVNNVRSNYEQTRRDITLAIASLIDELKNREAVLLTEAEAQMQSQLRMFHMQQETAEVELASVASFCESVGTSFPNGQLVHDIDLANMRSQSNRYSQEIDALLAQTPADVQKLRVILNDQATISSYIQNFGRFVDTSQQQQPQQPQIQNQTNQIVYFQQQQPRFSSAAYPQTATQYEAIQRSVSSMQGQPQNDQYRRLENLYYANNSAASPGRSLSQTIGYRPTQADLPRSIDYAFGDLNMTVPARSNPSSYIASWDPQSTTRRSASNIQSSSIFGSNPFAATNSRTPQRPPAQPPVLPETTPRRNFVTSTNAARSLDGDDRPIFGGPAGGSIAAPMRGRGRVPVNAPIPEHEPLTNGLQRQGTFVLDQPSLPNLPQSGAQKPRDTVKIQELYNVRRRRRAQTPVAFTVNLNEEAQPSSASEVADNNTR